MLLIVFIASCVRHKMKSNCKIHECISNLLAPIFVLCSWLPLQHKSVCMFPLDGWPPMSYNYSGGL